MISRTLVRRLERLETRLVENRRPFFRVEFYEMDENGTLIHLDGRDSGSNDAQYKIHVVFVDAADGRPVTEKHRNAASTVNSKQRSHSNRKSAP